MNLTGKLALVTGASRGIGRSIAEKLIKYGAIVIGTSTNKISLSIIDSYLGENGKGMILDVSDPKSIKSVFRNINIEYGGIDILINNAGIVCDRLLIRMKDNEWNNIIETNLSSVFHLSKAAIKYMMKKRYGKIINIGSVIGNMGNVGQSNYAAAKSGIIGFSKSLAREVAPYGITVNVVSPGFIETDMTHTLNDKQRANILASIPIGRFGLPNEVADAVMFLISDKANYITGETLNVNGGICMS